MTIVFLVLAMATGTELRLQESAEVQGRYITLRDVVVADGLSDEEKMLLGRVYLGRSPEEGKERLLNVESISEIIERRGEDSTRYRFQGSAVLVRRVSGGVVCEKDPWRWESRKAIARFIAGKRGLEVERIGVEIISLAPAGTDDGVDIDEVKETGEGDFLLMRCRESGKEKFHCRATVVVKDPLFTATRALSVGESLREGDIVKEYGIADDGALVHENPDHLYGARLLKKIGKGERIVRGAVALKPLVKRGDIVRAKGEIVTTTAKALENGGLGEEISMEYQRTRNRFIGRVTGVGVVEIIEE